MNRCPPSTGAWRRRMSARPSSRRSRQRSRSSTGPVAVWLIALLVALVATVQLRSQAEVERSLVQADPATLAFSIDQLSRSNDELVAQINDLTQRRAQLQTGGRAAAGQQPQTERDQARVPQRPRPGPGPRGVLRGDAFGPNALRPPDGT